MVADRKLERTRSNFLLSRAMARPTQQRHRIKSFSSSSSSSFSSVCVASATCHHKAIVIAFYGEGSFFKGEKSFWLRHSVVPVGALGLLVLFTCGTQVKEL